MIELNHVNYVPEKSSDLMPVSHLCDAGFEVKFTRDGCNIWNGVELIGEGISEGNMYNTFAHQVIEDCVHVANQESLIEKMNMG